MLLSSTPPLLPGCYLADAADVHSPGVPRDCAALEGLEEPDLTALAAAAGRPSTTGGTAGSRRTTEEAAGHVPEAAVVDEDAALTRLQEVRGLCQPLLGSLLLGVAAAAGPVHMLTQACLSVPGARLLTRAVLGLVLSASARAACLRAVVCPNVTAGAPHTAEQPRLAAVLGGGAPGAAQQQRHSSSQARPPYHQLQQQVQQQQHRGGTGRGRRRGGRRRRAGAGRCDWLWRVRHWQPGTCQSHQVCHTAAWQMLSAFFAGLRWPVHSCGIGQTCCRRAYS